MQYVIFCTDKPGHGQVRLDNRPAHVDYLKANQDKLVVAGPCLTDDGEGMIGSMLVVDMADRAAAEAFAENDPYNKAGLFESVVVRPWKKVLPAD